MYIIQLQKFGEKDIVSLTSTIDKLYSSLYLSKNRFIVFNTSFRIKMSACSSVDRITESEIQSKPNSTKLIYVQLNTNSSLSLPNGDAALLTSQSLYTSPRNDRSDEKDFEMIELQIPRKESILTNISCESNRYPPSTIEHYGENDTQRRSSNTYPTTLPLVPPRLSSMLVVSQLDEEEDHDFSQKRSFPVSILLLEIGALVTIFIISMVLVLAIREEQVNLRTTMQVTSFSF